jgi:ParB-like chromosome segregation protein Spo0J
MEIEFIEIEKLNTHERIVPSVLNRLLIKMERENKFSVAIIVDANTMTILDGHHRFEAAKRLGCKKVPCLLVDYNDPEIKLGQ